MAGVGVRPSGVPRPHGPVATSGQYLLGFRGGVQWAAFLGVGAYNTGVIYSVTALEEVFEAYEQTSYATTLTMRGQMIARNIAIGSHS